jgi:hypothetical protein
VLKPEESPYLYAQAFVELLPQVLGPESACGSVTELPRASTMVRMCCRFRWENPIA